VFIITLKMLRLILGFWLFFEVLRVLISQIVKYRKMVKCNTFPEFFCEQCYVEYTKKENPIVI
jgi:hypothetical protein